MEFDEICKNAYMGATLSNCTPLPEKYAYLQLQDLYLKYETKQLTKEESIKLKNGIRQEYEYNSNEYNLMVQFYKENNKNKKENYDKLVEIEKSNNKDDILKAALEIIANIIRDETFVDRNLSKIDF